MKDPDKTIGNLIDTQNVSFLGSVSPDGFPEIKAMLKPRKREGIKTFYFTTNTSSQHVDHFRQNPQACVYFCDSSSFQGLMLRGFVEVLEDSKHKQMIWREGDTEYYPKGVTDPDYCVLRFTADQGRFYENYHSESFTIS